MIISPIPDQHQPSAASTRIRLKTREQTQDGAAAMAPRVGSQAYGPLVDLTKKTRTGSQTVPSASSASPSRRQGIEQDPVYAVTEKTPAPRRWIGLTVVYGLVVGAVVGVVRPGYSSRLPQASAAYSSVTSFVDVSGGQLGTAGTAQQRVMMR